MMSVSERLASGKLIFVVCLVLFFGCSGIVNSADAPGGNNSTRTVNNSVGSIKDLARDAVVDAGQRTGRFLWSGHGKLLLGARRRLQFALLPIMYKLGVISTMLVGLTVMVLKGLTIGVILLFVALANTLVKYKHQTSQPPQPVHFHLHPGDVHGKPPHHYYHHHGYEPSGPWDKASDEGDSNVHYESYDPSGHHKVPSPYKYSPYRYSHYGKR